MVNFPSIPFVLPLTLALALPTQPRSSTQASLAGDLVYAFRIVESESGDVTAGTARVHGDRTRIDMTRSETERKGGRNGGNSDESQYILLTDGGARMLTVHPSRKQVEQMDTPAFERIIGTALHGVSPLVKFRIDNVKISTARMGTGEKLLGYATEHIRMTERFDAHVRAMGFDGGTEHHTVTTDYWVSPGLDLGRNPLIALLANASTAIAQSDRDFVQQEREAREGVLQGTPLRTVVTSRSAGDRDNRGDGKETTRTIEITSLRKEAQPAALFEIPAGYRMKAGNGASFDAE